LTDLTPNDGYGQRCDLGLPQMVGQRTLCDDDTHNAASLHHKPNTINTLSITAGCNDMFSSQFIGNSVTTLTKTP